MHQQAFECYETHRKKRMEGEKRSEGEKKWWCSCVADLKQRAPCVPDLVQTEWMLVIQAVVMIISCAQGTEMQGCTRSGTHVTFGLWPHVSYSWHASAGNGMFARALLAMY
jgi:hypothetical protein